MVPNVDVSNELGHRMPGLNGKPIDQIDQACLTLNQRFKSGLAPAPAGSFTGFTGRLKPVEIQKL